MGPPCRCRQERKKRDRIEFGGRRNPIPNAITQQQTHRTNQAIIGKKQNKVEVAFLEEQKSPSIGIYKKKSNSYWRRFVSDRSSL
jgi:hypothetical protein